MAAKKLRETGNLAEADGETEEEFSPKALFMAVGLKKAMEFDLAAGGKMYENGV